MKEMKWISVKDKLPENIDDVLAWSAAYQMHGVFYYRAADARWIAQTDYIDFDCGCQTDKGVNITHWMPLPKPPQLTP